MGRPEGEIEDYLMSLAAANGFRYDKFTSPSRAGMPDRVLIGHGQTVFVELKAPGEKPRKLQLDAMRDINRKGGLAVAVDGRDAADALIRIVLDHERSCPAQDRLSFQGRVDSSLRLIAGGTSRRPPKRKPKPTQAPIPAGGACILQESEE